MTTALGLASVLGVVGVLVMQIRWLEMRRERDAAADKASANAAEITRLMALSIDQGRRLEAVIAQQKIEIAGLDEMLAKATDPAVVRERLRTLLGAP